MRLGQLAAALAMGAVAALVPPPASAEPPASVMRQVLSTAAQVVVTREGGGRRSGSSIVLGQDAETGGALLVTAAHVFTPVEPQTIQVYPPLRRVPVPARLLALDDAADLAILEVDAIDASQIVFADQSMLGDPVWVASFPWGGRATVVSGMVSQIVWEPAEEDAEFPFVGPASLIDATVSHGMSGGGVFSRDSGALVGIVRSHRSVEVTLPGEPARTLTLPVAGETNVVPTQAILCFLLRSGYREVVPAGLGNELAEKGCKLTN